MADDDLLREASDPTTPADRLAALLQDALRELPAHSLERLPTALGERLARLARNPSLPLALLGDLLRSATLRVYGTHAWYNPSVPLLLLQEPSPDYEDAALRALLHVEHGTRVDVVPGTLRLERRVRFWATHRPSVIDAWSPARMEDARAFARHLAALFSLPWPSP